MTGAATVIGEAEPLRRWTLCFLLVLGFHAAPVALAVAWFTPQPEIGAAAPSAIMLDLAPLPTAPETLPNDIPPGPQQTIAAPPPAPEPEPNIEEAPEPPPGPKRAVALPPKPKPRPAQPRPREQPREVSQESSDRPAAPATTAPTAAPDIAETAAAPANTVSAPPAPSYSAPTWQGLLLGQLERFKRYPSSAQSRRQEGVAYLRFTMDRSGRVLSFRIERSSGHAALDEETLALIERAQPLPKPPANVPGETLELVVPVEFFLRERR